MFSFYDIVEIQELQEVTGAAIIGGVATVLGIRHLIKRGKERDAMMDCRTECMGITDRKEREKCIVDCFNRKITIMTKSYKTRKLKKTKKVSEQGGIQNVSGHNMSDKTPNSSGKTLASDKIKGFTNLSPWRSPQRVKGKSLVSVVGRQ